MKKIISLMLAVVMTVCCFVVPVMAEAPTATYTAKLVGDTIPNAGERFVIAVQASNISTGNLTSANVRWNWPIDVATPIMYALPTITVAPVGAAAVGNIHNPWSSTTYTGLFVSAPGQFDLTDADGDGQGQGGAAIYVDTTANTIYGNVDAVGTDATVTLYEVAFKLNEGQSFEDFYFTLKDAEGFFSSEASTSANGDITLVGIEKKEEIIYMNSAHQPGVNSKDVDGVYELPQALTDGRTYEVSFTLETSGTQGNNTLVALNNAAQMTANNYFTNSTIMMKFDGNTDIMVRNGANTTKVGSLGAAATTVDVKYTVDLINKVWGVTVTENGAVTVEQSGLAFRDTGGHLPIDALVLADNDSRPDCLWVNADSIKIVDTTPASVGEVVFNYVTADGTVLETATMSGEVGATVEVAAKTITDANGVKYEAPAASGVVGTDTTVEVVCGKIETVTISYTVDGVEVGTATVEGVAGATVDVAAYNYYTAEAIYEAAASTITVDPANLTVAVELTVAYEGIVATHKQTAEGIRALDEAITGTATVSYDVVLINPGDAVVALDNAAALDGSDNFFRDSSAYLAFKGGEVFYRQSTDTDNVKLADVTVPGTYKVSATVDAEAKTWTVSIADAEGTVLGSVENAGWRNVAPAELDSIVVLDNGGAGGTLVVQNLVVEAEGEEPSQPGSEPDDEPSQPESEPDDEPSQPESEPDEEPSQPESEPDDEPSQPESEPDDEPSQPESEPDDEPSQPESEPDDEPSQPESEPDDEPSQPESEPDDEPSQPESEPDDEPSDEPSEEPAELPFEAVDVEVTTSALGVSVTGKFVDADTTYENVVIVYTYLKNGKPHSASANYASVVNGEVVIEGVSNATDDGEMTVGGVSIYVGTTPLEIMAGTNLGTPVGAYK